MKKLLFITSLLFFCAVVGSCQSHSKSSSTDSKSTGAKKSGSQSSSEGSSQTQSAGKDTTRKAIGGRAIVHGEPDQAQLDSLKKAKTKSKNDK